MKAIIFRPIGVIVAAGLCLAFVSLITAEENTIQRVLFKDGVMFFTRDGKTSRMEEELTLPGQIKVMTNGVYTVGGGKKRTFKEGQVLGADGTLTSPDGSVMPVWDHYAMKNGKMMMYRDGEGSELTQPVVLPDGGQLLPDGSVVHGIADRTRLLDGQLLRLNGAGLPARDSITMNNKKVMVQKDGSMLTLEPGRSIMMSDGTKVMGDGTIIKPDGQTMTVTEGQIIPVEGVVRLR